MKRLEILSYDSTVQSEWHVAASFCLELPDNYPEDCFVAEDRLKLPNIGPDLAHAYNSTTQIYHLVSIKPYKGMPETVVARAADRFQRILGTVATADTLRSFGLNDPDVTNLRLGKMKADMESLVKCGLNGDILVDQGLEAFSKMHMAMVDVTDEAKGFLTRFTDPTSR